ncbi:hypothetical protein [Streptomyces sp. NBC_01594]|uniref:hypothetical protein n=1 Tax=Streptomyces sp. NBC_01594 TaxID=2975890 RepID=UPI00386598AF
MTASYVGKNKEFAAFLRPPVWGSRAAALQRGARLSSVVFVEGVVVLDADVLRLEQVVVRVDAFR